MINSDIPCYVVDEIVARERKRWRFGIYNTTRYGYLEYQNGGLAVSVVVAKRCKMLSRDGDFAVLMKKVCVRIVGDEHLYLRDCDYSYGGGYRFLWKSYTKKCYKFDVAVINDYTDKEWGMYFDDKKSFFLLEGYGANAYINLDLLKETEFRYAAWDNETDLYKYLTAYKQNPAIEFLTKTLSSKYATNRDIVSLCGKDKAFMLFLRQHADEIKQHGYPGKAVIRAYKNKTTVAEEYAAIRILVKYSMVPRWDYAWEYKHEMYAHLKNLSPQKLIVFEMYVEKVGELNYSDYIKACVELGVDLDEPKNLMPHDFKRWHDIRIDELASKRAKEDEEKRAALVADFRNISAKYCGFNFTDKFLCVIIAKTPAELVYEGEYLHHCVGKMGYDSKMSKGKSLIFFIRKADEPTVPYVTAEISPNGILLQCYGDHDSRPDDKVMSFVNEEWLPRIEKIISKGAIKYDRAV